MIQDWSPAVFGALAALGAEVVMLQRTVRLLSNRITNLERNQSCPKDSAGPKSPTAAQQ